MLDQWHDIGIEAAEQEAAIGFEPGDLGQIVRALFVEGLGISRAAGILHLEQLAGLLNVQPWKGQVKVVLLPRLWRHSIAPR